MPSLLNPFFCKKHGQLDFPQVQRVQLKTRKNPYYKCRICIAELKKAKKHYGNLHHPKKGSRAYEKKLETAKLRKRRDREALKDYVIKDYLKHHIHLPNKLITPELIETCRAMKEIKNKIRKSSKQPSSEPS